MLLCPYTFLQTSSSPPARQVPTSHLPQCYLDFLCTTRFIDWLQEDPDDYDEEGFDDDAVFEEGDFDEFLEEVDEPEGEGGEILEAAALGGTEDRLGPAKPLSGVEAIEAGLVDVVKDDLDLEEAEELGTVEELEGNEGLIAVDEGTLMYTELWTPKDPCLFRTANLLSFRSVVF